LRALGLAGAVEEAAARQNEESIPPSQGNRWLFAPVHGILSLITPPTRPAWLELAELTLGSMRLAAAS